MSGRDIVRCAIFSLTVVTLPIHLWSAGWCAAEVASKTENLDVTPSLVREIQFMLLRLGIQPGPIDGVIGPQTTAAWRKFQQDTGLPQVDLANGTKIPAATLTQPRRRQRQRSPRYSRLPRRPIALPRAPSMPKTSRSARPSTPPKNICRKGLTARLRARSRC
jgi:peptidoglycan hydrolase-like protein with peptidoglycan-binding domain